MNKQEIQKKLNEIETAMAQADFWQNKSRAQDLIQEHQTLKDALEGLGRYDRNPAVMTIFAGAGGDDAEDFVRMLLEMYTQYAQHKNWTISYLTQNQADHGGYRNVTLFIEGKNVYSTLKRESGVHRLVRVSPFNANGKRQTSFAMVEVIPKIPEQSFHDFEIPEDDLEIQFTRSGGPGGQNVNKRETAVRMKHVPSGITVHVHSERTQERNRDIALSLIRGKLIRLMEVARRQEFSDLSGLKDTSNEWGNQMRSYVLHPYKLIKDHGTGTEFHNVERVLEDGDLDVLYEAIAKDLDALSNIKE